MTIHLAFEKHKGSVSSCLFGFLFCRCLLCDTRGSVVFWKQNKPDIKLLTTSQLLLLLDISGSGRDFQQVIATMAVVFLKIIEKNTWGKIKPHLANVH